MDSQHVIVIGAGAWGLPTALQLQDRGHRVTLLERFELGSGLASNAGSSRLWRLADTQIWRSRAMVGTLRAMERLSERLGEPVFRRTGMLWRDDVSLEATAAALDSIGERYARVASDDVGDHFPGLQPDGRDALHVEQAGVVFADRLLRGAAAAFRAGGGTLLERARAVAIRPRPDGASVELADGRALAADQVLLAAGPGTGELLPSLDVHVPLRPYVEQVVHFGEAGSAQPAPDLPGLVDCAIGDAPGMYAMPDGQRGYKAGLDHPLRALEGGVLGDDLDR